MYNKVPKTSISTLGIKIFFLIVLFFGLPYLLVTLINNYQAKALGILEQQNTVMEIQTGNSSEIKVLTQAEAKTLGQIHDFIQGAWVSEYDGRYRLVVDDNSKFEEFYDGKKEGFGAWRVFSATKDKVSLSTEPEFTASNGTSSADTSAAGLADSTASADAQPLQSAYTKSEFENDKIEDPKYFFQKQQFESGHKGEIYIYQIQQLDTEKFVLVFKNGAGKPLVFIRATSTESAAY